MHKNEKKMMINLCILPKKLKKYSLPTYKKAYNIFPLNVREKERKREISKNMRKTFFPSSRCSKFQENTHELSTTTSKSTKNTSKSLYVSLALGLDNEK